MDTVEGRLDTVEGRLDTVEGRLDLLSIMSKDGVSIFTWFNVTRMYPVIVSLNVRWFLFNETRFA